MEIISSIPKDVSPSILFLDLGDIFPVIPLTKEQVEINKIEAEPLWCWIEQINYTASCFYQDSRADHSCISNTDCGISEGKRRRVGKVTGMQRNLFWFHSSFSFDASEFFNLQQLQFLRSSFSFNTCELLNLHK